MKSGSDIVAAAVQAAAVNTPRYDGKPLTRGDYVQIPCGQVRQLHPVTGSQQRLRARAHLRAANRRSAPIERWTGSEWVQTGTLLEDYGPAEVQS